MITHEVQVRDQEQAVMIGDAGVAGALGDAHSSDVRRCLPAESAAWEPLQTLLASPPKFSQVPSADQRQPGGHLGDRLCFDASI